MSRLISRLRSRQFGVLVTTSYLADQAYQEIRDDGHPIVVISGNDIVEILSRVGFRTGTEVRNYLQTYHPRPTSRTSSATVDFSFLPPEVDIEIASELPDDLGTVPLQEDLLTRSGHGTH